MGSSEIRHPKQAESTTRDGSAAASAEASTLRERARVRNDEEKMVRGRTIRRGDIVKIWGLVVFVVVITAAIVLMWPYVKDMFGGGGVGVVVDKIRNAGAAGVLILLALQFLQVVVAIIPGEVVQLAAGLMYGPLWGTVILVAGATLSSAVVYKLVHSLGAPFVRDMVSPQHMERFNQFQNSGKLDVVVFVLFLIPGLPKDAFTYLVPLTEMKMKDFLLITTVARTPGILGSTYVASGLANGNIAGSIVVIVIVAVAAALCIAFREKISEALKKSKTKD